MSLDRFFEMEEKYQLFDTKFDDNFPSWDIVRFYVYRKYFWPPLLKIKNNQRKSLTFLLRGVFIVFRSVFSLFFVKSNNVVFSFSRHLDEKGLLFDKVTQHIVAEFGKAGLVIENVKASNKYLNIAELNFSFLYRRIKSCNVNLNLEVYHQIENALIDCFGVSKVSYVELNYIYQSFVKDYNYYRFLFKLKRVKRIFLVQNEIQKGMFLAAKSLGIEVFEFQHGSFGRDNLAYSYPDFITSESDIIVPDYLLTFGTYWGSNINIPMKVEAIGNDYFSKTHSVVKSDGSILFISSLIHGDELFPVAINLSKLDSTRIVYFKLHPNEYFKFDYYANLLKAHPSIILLKNEFNLSDLIAKSCLVVLINSTVLYEALSQNAKVAIYKRVNYLSQSDIFDLSNVFLFDTLDELVVAINAEKEENKVIFFDKLNKEFLFQLVNTNV